ncbi:hypothetical protein GCM10010505_61860 [Kitasatospora aburaviensis]
MAGGAGDQPERDPAAEQTGVGIHRLPHRVRRGQCGAGVQQDRPDITMQAAMAVSVVSSLTLATLTRGTARALAGTAGLLTVTSFLVTRFGNVPINGRIKQWAVTAPPADHAEILHRWQLFNNVRTLSGVLAFAVLIYVALRREGVDCGSGSPRGLR